MTPQQLEAMARNQYNAVGDTMWSSAEIFDLIYAASMELAIETKCIEQTFSSTVTDGQAEYDFPTNVIGIKRITYDGKPLDKITFREDDYITGNNQASTNEGTPMAYAEWNETLYLRPIPDNSTSTIKIFAYIEPQAVTSTSVLEIPTRYHLGVVDYLLYRMYAKDKDFASSQYFEQKWKDFKESARRHERRKTKGDKFAGVQDEETMNNSVLRQL